MRIFAAGLVLLWLPLQAAAMCTDTASNDCDDDGFPASAGDCDDEDPNVHPGADDICGGIDEDCDGTIDEGCDNDNPLADATLVGGQSCATAGVGGGWLALVSLLLVRRRC